MIKLPQLTGSLDKITDEGILDGWVALADDYEKTIQVEIFFNDRKITQITANKFREDLKNAKIGNGQHGFLVKIPTKVLKVIYEEGGFFSLNADNCDASNIAPLSVKAKSKEVDAILANYIAHSIESIDETLFSNDSNDDDLIYGLSEDSLVEKLAVSEEIKLNPYIHFTLNRTKQDNLLGEGIATYNNAMQFYLRSYASMRMQSEKKGHRVPLSANDISYYNTPINQPLIHNIVSQASFHYSDLLPDIPISPQLNDPNVYRLFTYRWAIDIAPQIAVEDCLVPDAYVANLNKISFANRTEKYALCNFSEVFFNHRITELTSILNINDKELDRGILYAIILLESFKRPDFNRYIPTAIREDIFLEWQNKGRIFSLIMQIAEDFCSDFNCVDIAEKLFQKDFFDRAMKKLGFSVADNRFLTLTKSGNRIHAAQLPIPKKTTEIYDVQIIGPFEKASGLGQACRLSAQALIESGFKVNCVDFGLDNPALEGYSTNTQLGKLAHAKINLIHLNAESIPLAIAYLPDVFTGCYNIGYFFWELNTPAACHALALELLDEVWVSSEYGVDIYQPHSSIPVSNVGMTVEALEHQDKKRARAYLAEQFNVGSNQETVFLCVFDSFSFVQRKNPIGVIRAFQQAFSQGEKVELLIKTQNRFFVEDPVQVKIWQEIDHLVVHDSRIKIINETLTYSDLLYLKSGCDVYVSLHRSEGWGFGMIEAMNLEVPVICTGYSGNMDFCSEETTWLVDYELVYLNQNDYIFVVPGQQWAEPCLLSATKAMQEAYQNPQLREEKAAKALTFIRENFSMQAISKRYSSRIKDVLKVLSQG